MPTICNVTYCLIDESVSKLKATSTWSVWDCSAKKWSNLPKVVLRNTLLAGLHQDINSERFCIGEVPENTKDASLLNPFTTNKNDRYQLDLASNSRNHGRFTFNLAPIGKSYYGDKATEQWKRIIYGSIMHTGCKHLVGTSFRYVIVDDTARDNQGNPQDDPVNKRHWNSGDSHAKGSADFMNLLGAGTVDFDVDDEMDVTIPLQFRISAFKEWVAIRSPTTLNLTTVASIWPSLGHPSKATNQHSETMKENYSVAWYLKQSNAQQKLAGCCSSGLSMRH